MLNKKYFLLLIIVFATVLINIISAQTNISTCQTISSAGDYQLNTSITGAGTCLTIASSNVIIDCQGNTISYGSDGTSSKYGITALYLLTPLNNITIKNCIIKDINSSGSTGVAIRFQKIENSYIFNNTIQTNGTSSAHGIVFTTSCKNNTIENNTINTFGTSTGNYGVYLLAQSTNNNITGNTINGTGTTTSSAIYFATNADENLVFNNTLYTFSTLTLVGDGQCDVVTITTSNSNNISWNSIYGEANVHGDGVYIATNAESNIIENNNIIINLTNATGAHEGFGVETLNSQLVTIQNNNIALYGTSTLYGIYAQNTANVTIQNNNINLDKVMVSSISGIQLTTGSPYSTIQDNNITISGTSILYGIVASTSSFSEIKNNNISVNGTTALYGIYTTISTDIGIENNNITVKGITTASGVYTMGISLLSSINHTIDNNSIFTLSVIPTYGISLSTGANNNTIKNNSITAVSSTTNVAYGIIASTSLSNLIENNTILPYGTGNSKRGIRLLTGSNQNTVKNNFVNTTGGLGTSNYGIELVTSNDNLIELNSIFTNGTNTNYGIVIITAANNNIIRNNSISTNGTTTSNRGIVIGTSNNNLIESNNISTHGTSENHGVHAYTQANNNTIKSNTIVTGGTSSLYGTLIEASNYNKIIGNNITTNGSVQTSSISTSNLGLYIVTNSYYTEVYNNTINNGGGRYNYGIQSSSNSRNGTFMGNNIFTRGTGARNAAFYLSESSNNNFENNTISTNGSSTNYGIYIISSSNTNTIKNNNITTFGGTTSHAFYLVYVAGEGYPNDNQFINNTLFSIDGTNLYISTGAINGTNLTDQAINTYYFTSPGHLITVENTTAGKIKFLQYLTGTTQTNFDGRINIQNNFAHIDDSVSGLNKSAEITFYNMPTRSTELQIYRNEQLCNDICTNLTSLQAGNVIFNVSFGGNYSINPDSNLPTITLNQPEEINSSSQLSLNFNFTTTDDTTGDLNCSVYINNTLTQTNSSTINNTLTNFLVQNIAEGFHSWYIECFDGKGNRNISETRNFTITISQPLINFGAPDNNTYIDNPNFVLLNYTALDSDLRTMTVWLYGDDIPLNISENIADSTLFSYNWTDLSLGKHNWSIIIADELENSSREYSFFNITNLTMTCEAGGPYQQNSLVLMQGNITNAGTALSQQEINVTLYQNNNFDNSILLNSSNNGLFQTTFSNLATGIYTLNLSTEYNGITKTCTNSFIVGGAASFVLDKIATIENITNDTINYNITLRLTNKGGSNATNVNITDADYENSYFEIGTIIPGEIVTKTYLLNFTRDSFIYYNATSVAEAQGINSYSNNLISANANSINLTIPSTATDEQLTIIKNIVYNNQTSEDVNYTVSVQVVNSGGTDITNALLVDSDLNKTGANSLTISRLNRTESYPLSGYLIIDKNQENTEHKFEQTTVSVGTNSYGSNEIIIIIPGSGNGPNDLTVEAPASVYVSASFDSTITIVNMNDDIGQDFTINYWITSSDYLTNYSSSSRTLFVAANGGANTTSVTLNAPASAGDYILMSSIRESKKTSSDSFIVANYPTTENTKKPSSGGGGGGGGSTYRKNNL